MISSIPNFFCCITKPFRNKIVLKNESDFKVQYEVYIYKGSSIDKIDAAIGAAGVTGKAALEITKAEAMRSETGFIHKKRTIHVTCGYGGKIAVRYKFCEHHDDYTEELRNFSVLDVVRFEQPEQEDIDNAERKMKKKETLAEKEKVCKEAKEIKECKEAEEKKNVNRICSSLSKGMCSAIDTPKIQCPRCGDWYCNHHHTINNNPFGRGGHVCC